MRAPRRVSVFKLVLVGSLGLLILPRLALAAPTTTSDVTTSTEPTEYRYEFGLTAGWHVFNDKSGLGRAKTDDPGLSPADNVAFGGRLALNFNRWVSIEGEALAIPTRTRDHQTDLWAFAYRGSVNVHLVPSGPLRPFVTVGFGGISTIVNNSSVVPGDTDGFFHAGVGLKLALGPHVGLRGDARILFPPAILGSQVAVGNETGYDGPDWEFLGGLYLNFGPVERLRETIVTREVVNVLPPPPTDPDGDGIVGDADKCPNLAEDKDGFEDEDGCPDPDNDKDGIPDALDKCPNDPEDKDGFEDQDGCPDPDNDKDGIPDALDKCPNEPETKNGYQDEDGCPDELPAAIKKFTGVIQGINFKTAQAKILPGSYAILDRAVEVLKRYPDIRMEVSGHTDSRGKADYNRDLSQRRADSVKLYLISKGIDSSRLMSVGYGLDRPIADNLTESGRSKNRRTEFRLLMRDEGRPAAPGGAGPGAAPPAGDSGPTPGDSGPPPPIK